ncbi:L-asparaginase precursor [Pleomassaria siparia CBS 279.74]|uniref:L-asparaginase n=1 Tax=Pleomassaria siparia CBS 279.74 TaxID=1314801 RepID=A0A6G1KNI6_9PLEO|nr:L-asparaginase precursor [Pleomassaria siparia CBS 279.74]
MQLSPHSRPKVQPRIIIHGGAGNITKQTISKQRYAAFEASLRRILASSAALLSIPGATALDVATFAVSQLEDDELYNSGHGAVFTRAGTNELECSIMVSDGYQKRGASCMLLQHVRNPIKLAREILVRGESDDGGGAQDHCQYSGPYVEQLAKEWGLDIVDTEYFWTKGRWEEHQRGLKEDSKKKENGEKKGSGEDGKSGLSVTEMSDWEKTHYIPLGTCGAVVLDSFGTICTATSTGGLTNKIPGRIGDTPSTGTGFWAEEWFEEPKTPMMFQSSSPISSLLDHISRGNLQSLVGDCFPNFANGTSNPSNGPLESGFSSKQTSIRHAVGLSGTGNGDTFIRMAAARTVAAKSRFSSCSLASATTWMAGPGGELQKSAGDRWGHVHEGVGGIIGIEVVGTNCAVVSDFNCGGMFRAWVGDDGEHKCLIFREEDWENGPEK